MSSTEQFIYLDNNATTRPDPAVVEAMLPCLAENWGNPSSAYGFGAKARKAVETAREQMAALLECEPAEIVFTSGGTESNHTALLSALQVDPLRRHVVISSVEHSTMRQPCQELARHGFEISFVKVNSSGVMDLQELEDAIRHDTALVSVMLANNETGLLFPLTRIAEICRSKGVLFHTDAVQAIGKIPVRTSELGVHALSLSAHKFHGPKGVGALYVNRKARFRPFIRGGGQEKGRRAGTENVAGIVGLGKAAELAPGKIRDDMPRVEKLRDRLEQGLLERIPGTQRNGAATERVPNTTNLSFDGIDASALLILLDQRGICCSIGSACLTGSMEPSHVLTAMGLGETRARSSVRFSLSRFNTAEDIDRALQILPEAIQRIRGPRSSTREGSPVVTAPGR